MGTSLLSNWVGSWRGNSRLIQHGQPERASESELAVTPVVLGRFVRVDYTWAYMGKGQEGSLLLGFDSSRAVVEAAWVDSWHMGEKMMICPGEVRGDGGVSVLGSYAAPPGADWGWRIEIGPEGGGLVMRMFNISPEGKGELAVEGVYRRE
jgi:hypothetical protein